MYDRPRSAPATKRLINSPPESPENRLSIGFKFLDPVLSGFSEGTKFSAGAALGATRWSLPGIDADKTFISAPENFSGTMLITVTLYSSRQEILETKAARFEWSGSVKGDKLPVTISPARRLSQ
jgi:hypothetical protein